MSSDDGEIDNYLDSDETWLTFTWPAREIGPLGMRLRVEAEVGHRDHRILFTIRNMDPDMPEDVATFMLTIDSLERLVRSAKIMEGMR